MLLFFLPFALDLFLSFKISTPTPTALDVPLTVRARTSDV